MKSDRFSNAENLVDACRRKIPRAQESLYRMFSAKMMGVCSRYAPTREEAEDILQNGFVKVFEKIGSFRGDGSLEGWIRRIMVTTAIEAYRKNLRLSKVVSVDDVHDQQQVTFDMNGLEVKDLLNLVQQLATGYRLVFNMYVIEGFSHKEIAEQLDISEGASKSQLSRARSILKEKILKMEEQSYASCTG